MFSATAALLKKRAIPAYGVFMMKMKNHPDLKACKTIGARGKLTAKMYKKLTPGEKAKLAAEGKKGRA